MKVSLLDIYRPGDNRDYNGGYGTTFNVGKSLRARMLSFARSRGEYFPLLSYGYVSAVMKAAGHSVNLNINEIDRDADLVVLHASLIRHNEELATLKEIKATTKSHICVVGPFASKKPEVFEGLADTIIYGEPEYVLKNVKTLSDLPKGLTHAPKIEIDTLPFPDWTIYEYNKFTQNPILKNRPTAFILSSRSCPYKCNYCPYIVFENAYETRSIDSVVDELVHLKNFYGVRAVMFRDPTFTMNRKRTLQMVQAIQKKNLKLELGCETRTDRLDKELIDEMYAAGFRAIKIGVESSNHEDLIHYKRRPPAIEHQEEMVRYAEKKGIRIIAFYILGLPNDTIETMENTIRYSHHLGSSLANFTVCTPIPGTEFYEEMKDRIFDFNYNNYDNFNPVFRTNHLTANQIKEYQEKALVKFYFRPAFFSNMFSNIAREWVPA